MELVVDDEHPNGYVANVVYMNVNANNTYPRKDIDLSEWDTIKLTSYSYNILDEEGNYITDWINSNEVLTMEINIEDEYEISFEDIDIVKDYYCIFKIKDSQDNIYYSNIIGVNNK